MLLLFCVSNKTEIDIFATIQCQYNLDINFRKAWIKGYLHFTFQLVFPSVFFRNSLNASSLQQHVNMPVSAPNH